MTTGRPRSRQCFFDDDFGAVASLNHFLSRGNLTRVMARRGSLHHAHFAGTNTKCGACSKGLDWREAESFASNLGRSALDDGLFRTEYLVARRAR